MASLNTSGTPGDLIDPASVAPQNGSLRSQIQALHPPKNYEDPTWSGCLVPVGLGPSKSIHPTRLGPSTDNCMSPPGSPADVVVTLQWISQLRSLRAHCIQLTTSSSQSTPITSLLRIPQRALSPPLWVTLHLANVNGTYARPWRHPTKREANSAYAARTC